jgi:hypothetical protein
MSRSEQDRQWVQVMIMAHDPERGRLAFSTKKLEPAPGDMLKDPAKVFARAEEMAQLFKIRVAAAEQAAREEEARLVQEFDAMQRSQTPSMSFPGAVPGDPYGAQTGAQYGVKAPAGYGAERGVDTDLGMDPVVPHSSLDTE